eukprot:6218803-Prymnesium_polylepis.1
MLRSLARSLRIPTPARSAVGCAIRPLVTARTTRFYCTTPEDPAAPEEKPAKEEKKPSAFITTRGDDGVVSLQLHSAPVNGVRARRFHQPAMQSVLAASAVTALVLRTRHSSRS